MKSQRAQGIRKGKGPMGMMGMGDDDILAFRGTMRVGGSSDDYGETRVVHTEQLDAIQKAFFKDNFNDKE